MPKNSSIESSFQFINYKIDKIDFNLTHNTQFILRDSNKYNAEYMFGFRDTGKIKKDDKFFYVGGLGLKLLVKNQNNDKVAEGEFSITGVFGSKNEFSPKNETNLAKYQIPAILFPYLRAAITNILASSGFHNIILPLINIQEAAKEASVKVFEIQ